MAHCMHCGSILPDDWTAACPQCGQTGKRIEVNVSDGVVERDDHKMGFTDGTTGRYAVHSDSVDPTDTLLIEKLVQDYVQGNTADLEAYIDQYVSPFDFRALVEDTFYRGIPASKRPLIPGDRIGPALVSGEGRYNSSGRRALYLIDDLRFLSAEIKATEMLVQKYRINLSSLRVADLTSENEQLPNSLSLLFQAAERGATGAGWPFERELQSRGKSRYTLSQSLASAFDRRSWQGILVPGVHGAAGVHYRNLALWGDCVEAWQDWAVGPFFARTSVPGVD